MSAATPVESSLPADVAPSPAFQPADPETRAAIWRFGAVPFDPRRNSLNLLRLVFAYLVLIAHGWYIAGAGVGPHLNGENIGGWAVFGFFAISGYLITGSRLAKPLGEYLVHRIARIFPAFLTCLALTAGVFAPLNWFWFHGSLQGFLSTATTPANYVLSNLTLRMNVYDVGQTPLGVPYASAWDGSLWSLYYEFGCYLVIAVLASFAWFRRSPWGLTAVLALAVAVQANGARVMPYLGNHPDALFMIKLLPFFLGGGLLYLLKDRITLTWPLALASVLVGGALVLRFESWGAQAAAPLIAYVILWLGAVLPMPDLMRRHDVSYGIYIYAFPVQQLLAMTGLYRHGLVVFDVLAALATIPLAIGSWLLIERPVMRRARGPRRMTSS